MGIMVTQDDDKSSDLNQRITADLRQKVQTADITDQNTPDLAENSDYVKDLKKTGRFSWIWVVLIILALIAIIFIAVF